ncbi:Mitochondrial GTPase [Physocladia obscura]|uniref:Mitochondrial GTPase n=1 Tax=Physocladia obscura TaxID=109957 RepID=A0AAD5SUQ0_9FUNG|nr:Mitochondrial GTPase [Physocladia obscura]
MQTSLPKLQTHLQKQLNSATAPLLRFIPPPVSSVLPWFPKHQQNAVRLLRDGLHHIDLVVEVRDARIPLSSANPQFDKVLGNRDRIIVFNKFDLANHNMCKKMEISFKKYTSIPFIFLSAKKRDSQSMKSLMNLLVEKANSNRQRYSGMSVIVVGLPNVGKSSIVNSLRNCVLKKPKAAKVADFAGVTQSIQTKVKIHDNPVIYLVDTPGVINPQTKSPLQGLRIAVTGCSKDSLTNELALAQYLLFRLNQSETAVAKYTKTFKMPPVPEPRIEIVLKALEMESRSHRHELSIEVDSTVAVPRILFASSLSDACLSFLQMFRNGSFGQFMLDDCRPEGVKAWFETHGGADPDRGVAVMTPDFSKQREEKLGIIVYEDEDKDAMKNAP